jgi:hypothetical protein
VKRFHQVLLIGTLLPLCWLWMMAVHELGHVLAAAVTGGRVLRVVLHPLAISRTYVMPNPAPLAVAWSGPLVGVSLPVACWALCHGARWPVVHLLRFFAGFCLIANGSYIGLGSLGGVGDAGVMLAHGTPAWMMWLFGGLCLAAGLRLWHGLGPQFGLAPDGNPVEPREAYRCAALLLTTVVVELMFTRFG